MARYVSNSAGSCVLFAACVAVNDDQYLRGTRLFMYVYVQIRKQLFGPDDEV